MRKSNVGRWSSIREALLPPAGPLRLYAVVVFIDALGTGLFAAGSVVFFTRRVGLAPVDVGLGLSVAALVGLLAAVPAGRAGDRYGHRRVLMLANVAQAVSVSCYLLVDDVRGFLVVVVALGVAESAARPVRRALLSDLAAGQARVRASAYNRSVSNVAFSLGALLAGAALAADTAAGYISLVLGDALSFLLASALLARLRRAVLPRAVASASLREQQPQARRHSPFRDRRYVLMSLICGLLNLNASLLEVGLPLWVITRTEAPRYLVAVLLLVNTVLAVVLTVPTSRGSETVAGAARAARRAGLVLALSCVVLAAAPTPAREVPVVALLVLGVLLLTAGELFSSAGSWGLSYGLAPEGHHGEYLGVFTTVSQAAQVVGPALMAFLVTAGYGAVAGLGFVFLVSGLAGHALVRVPTRLDGVPA